MWYSDEELSNIKTQFTNIPCMYNNLMTSYLRKKYNDPVVKEYVIHGFLRRLGFVFQSIQNIFQIWPPDLGNVLEKEKVSNAAINLQAFVFNVFGITDNIAWIWVLEKKIKKANGSPLRRGYVGLRKNNNCVFKSFSQDFQDYLKGLNPWFDYLENFRHALAHRIPLYVPPYVVPEGNLAAYNELEKRKMEAFERGDFAEHDRLETEQDALGEPYPVMTHSFREEAKFVCFHPQLLADFMTIEELGRKFLEELDR